MIQKHFKALNTEIYCIVAGLALIVWKPKLTTVRDINESFILLEPFAHKKMLTWQFKGTSTKKNDISFVMKFEIILVLL